MSRQNPYADDEPDDPSDLDTEADDFSGADDDLPEMACPACGGVVTEDTQKCPHCGDWITPQAPAGQRWRRGLFVAAVILMLIAILRWAL